MLILLSCDAKKVEGGDGLRATTHTGRRMVTSEEPTEPCSCSPQGRSIRGGANGLKETLRSNKLRAHATTGLGLTLDV